ncbi:hypothetical protein [Legionella maioricensis]|uniref:Tyrosine specific protein phosphatases domain-containing protein n=1 Tax=Legionella maioricensis TaxID=2896528 RepID=A0A9X2D4Y0_9GAMM|nr:hypothetical protein [Legionella maioricensis]MCL9685557.1 hypothetical protein [Legionella maioricensis]MCL9688883.1 hypothetical protein [Legionella maioricensis]
MKTINLVFCIFILIAPTLLAEAKDMKSTESSEKIPLIPGAFWIKNHWQNDEGSAQVEPVHWRSTTSTIPTLNEQQIKINEKGMEALFISGSAAPTLGNMLWLRKTKGKTHPIYILDLRQETHLYINGLPISLFYKRDEINWGKTPEAISETESAWIKYFLKSGVVKINKLGKPQAGFKVPIQPVIIPIKEVYTEQETAKKAGVAYIRIDVPDYHPPAPYQVDQFLTILKKIPPNAWLHVHCAAGNGRTTMFMVMRDILANAKYVRLEDIITRQAGLGGIDLFGVSPSLASQPWKKEYHQARKDYIRLFYTFVHSGASENQAFTSWIAKQPDSPYKSLLKTDAYCKTNT